MKIRTGFVSNSSSSSFIVMFDKRPSSRKEVKKLLFPDKDNEAVFSIYDYETTIGDIVDTVWKDLQGLRKLTKSKLVEAFQHSWSEFKTFAKQSDIDKMEELDREHEKNNDEYYKKYHAIRNKLGITPGVSLPNKTKANEGLLAEYENNEKKYHILNDRHWKAEDVLRKKMATDTMNEILKKYKGKYIVEFHYADEDGQFGCIMEHGDIFNNLDHYQISHH